MTTPYLIRRHATYYFRARVPSDLAPLIGTHIVRSLGTKYFGSARQKSVATAAKMPAVWNKLRAEMLAFGKNINELTISDIPDDDEELKRVALSLPPDDFQALGRRLAEIAKAETAKLMSTPRAIIADPLMTDYEIPAGPPKTTAEFGGGKDLMDPTPPVFPPFSVVPAERLAGITQIEHAQLLGKIEGMREALAALSISGNAPKKEEHPAKSGESWDGPIEDFFADRPSIGPSAEKSHRQAFRDLKLLIGSKKFKDISQSDIKAFADAIRDRKGRAGKAQLARETIVKLLQHVRAYFGWAVEAGYLAENPAEKIKPRSPTRAEKEKIDARRAFTATEFQQLFDSPLFVGCLSKERRATPGKSVYRDEKYWFFVLAALTGARTEEIGAMPSKLVKLGDIDCIDLRNINVKTSAGRRLIPILPDLRKIGIIEWANEQKKRGLGLTEGTNRPIDWSKWSNRYLDSIGLNDHQLVSYSLRHNFRQMARLVGSDEIADKIFGHEGDGVGAGYGRDLTPDEAALFIQKVKPPVPLAHLLQLKISKK